MPFKCIQWIEGQMARLQRSRCAEPGWLVNTKLEAHIRGNVGSTLFGMPGHLRSQYMALTGGDDLIRSSAVLGETERTLRKGLRVEKSVCGLRYDPKNDLEKKSGWEQRDIAF